MSREPFRNHLKGRTTSKGKLSPGKNPCGPRGKDLKTRQTVRWRGLCPFPHPENVWSVFAKRKNRPEFNFGKGEKEERCLPGLMSPKERSSCVGRKKIVQKERLPDRLGEGPLSSMCTAFLTKKKRGEEGNAPVLRVKKRGTLNSARKKGLFFSQRCERACIASKRERKRREGGCIYEKKKELLGGIYAVMRTGRSPDARKREEMTPVLEGKFKGEKKAVSKERSRT